MNIMEKENDKWLDILNYYVIIVFGINLLGGFIWSIVDAGTISVESRYGNLYGVFMFESGFAVFMLWITITLVYSFLNLLVGKILVSFLSDVKRIRNNGNHTNYNTPDINPTKNSKQVPNQQKELDELNQLLALDHISQEDYDLEIKRIKNIVSSK